MDAISIRVRACCGAVKTCDGAPVSTIRPLSITATGVGDLPGERHLVRDDDHGHAVARERSDHVQDFADHLRIQRTGRLVE